MNLFEALQMLSEMFFDRKHVLEKLSEQNGARYEHLLKIYFYRNSRKENFNDWCIEVANYSKLSKCSSKLKVKDMYRILWDEPKDDYDFSGIHVFIKNLEFAGYPEIKNFNEDNVFNYLKEFHEWLINIILEKKIYANDVANKLIELLNKYPIN